MGAGGERTKDRLSDAVLNVWFLLSPVNREIKDCCEDRRLLRARHLYWQQIFLSSKKKVCKGERNKACLYILMYLFLYQSTSFCFLPLPQTLIFTLTCITFMLLQQLVVELHHFLVLLELQHALAEVESQRQTHFLQRFPVLAVLIHLLSTQRGQGEVVVVVVIDGRGNDKKMKQECDNRKEI